MTFSCSVTLAGVERKFCFQMIFPVLLLRKDFLRYDGESCLLCKNSKAVTLLFGLCTAPTNLLVEIQRCWYKTLDIWSFRPVQLHPDSKDSTRKRVVLKVNTRSMWKCPLMYWKQIFLTLLIMTASVTQLCYDYSQWL